MTKQRKTYSRLTLAQRTMIEDGRAMPAMRFLDRAPTDRFPFKDHRTVAEADAWRGDKAPLSAAKARGFGHAR